MTTALMEFYRAAGGESWTEGSGWGKGEPCRNAWYGVYCCRAAYPRLKMVFTADEAHDPATDRCLDEDERTEGDSPSTLRNEVENGCGMEEDACVVVALYAASRALPMPQRPHMGHILPMCWPRTNVLPPSYLI